MVIIASESVKEKPFHSNKFQFLTNCSRGHSALREKYDNDNSINNEDPIFNHTSTHMDYQ